MDLADIDDTDQPPRDPSDPPGASDADLRLMLDRLLELRRAGSARPRKRVEHREAALALVAEIAREAAGWAMPHWSARSMVFGKQTARHFAVTDPVGQQVALIDALETPVSMLLPGHAEVLRDALIRLRQGEVVPLLQPGMARGQGQNGARKALAMLEILIWARWQHGLGMPWGVLLSRVAAALNCYLPAAENSPAKLEQWMRDLQQSALPDGSSGPRSVPDAEEHLQLALDVGLCQRSGALITDAEAAGLAAWLAERSHLEPLIAAYASVAAPRGRTAKKAAPRSRTPKG